MANIIETYLGSTLSGKEPLKHKAIIYDGVVTVMRPFKEDDGTVKFSPISGRVVEFSSLKGYKFLIAKIKGCGWYFYEHDSGMLVDEVYSSCRSYKDALKYILDYSNFRNTINSPESNNWETIYKNSVEKAILWKKNAGIC